MLCLVLVLATMTMSLGLTGTAKATESATISAQPTSVDATSTHTVHAKVESEDDGAPLRNINIDYNSASTKADVEDVDLGDVHRIGIDDNGDGTIETDLNSSLTGIEFDNNYHTLTFKFDESYTLEQDDTLVVEYGDVVNPDEPGDFETQIAINYGSTDHASKGWLSITEKDVLSGSATPSKVVPGETVTAQNFSVVIDNVTADGTEDTFYVELEDDVNITGINGASLNRSTDLTSGPSLVDGFDGDGVNDTVQFSANDSGGETRDLEVTINVSVEYPDEEGSHDIDFELEDSDDGTITRENVPSTAVEVGSVPEITDFAATNTSGRTIQISFNSSEELNNITTELTNTSGALVASLTEDDFSQTNNSGTYYYETNDTVSEDGEYTAKLTEADDTDNTDGSGGESATVDINTVAVGIDGGSANPANVSGGTTIDDQKVHVVLSNVSADGDTDTHYVEFPDALASGLSVNGASVNSSASIAQSAQLVDGFDNDSTQETVKFKTGDNSGGSISLNVTVNVSVEYPDTNATYGIDARVQDSDGDVAEVTNVTLITVSSENTSDSDSTDDSGGDTSDGGSTDGTDDSGSTDDSDGDDSGSTASSGSTSAPQVMPPSIAGLVMTTVDEEGNVTLTTTKSLGDLRVSVIEAEGAELSRTDFRQEQIGDRYVYTADLSIDSAGNGSVSATVESATNDGGDAVTSPDEPPLVGVPVEAEFGVSKYVERTDRQTVLDLPDGPRVDTVLVNSTKGAEGRVAVSVPEEEPPDGIATLSGDVVSVIDVRRPASIQNSSATITVTLSTKGLDTGDARFAASRYDEAAGEWDQLDIAVVNSTDDTATVRIPTPRTSVFAVTLIATTPQPTATPPSTDESYDTDPSDSSTAAPTHTEAPTESSAGFGLLIVLLALLVALLAALRRRD